MAYGRFIIYVYIYIYISRQLFRFVGPVTINYSSDSNGPFYRYAIIDTYVYNVLLDS